VWPPGKAERTAIMTATRKDIVKSLDKAAQRAADYYHNGATAKQTWFLAGLIAAAGEDAAAIGCGWANTSALLTSRQASTWIDRYLAAKAAA